MTDPENVIITVKNQGGDTVEFNYHWDVGIEDIVAVFKVILYWLTYDIKTIEEYLGGETETD